MKKAALVLAFFICFLNGYAQNEKVFAVMITGKDEYHFPLALRSIESFLEQTYPNKHLLIINDGSYNFDFLKSDLITEIKLNKKCKLGQLRNIALSCLELNSVWVQWDDDDWHHPNAIEKQYQHLSAQKADMCYMRKEIVYAFKINAAWELNGAIGGTIMCRKKKDIVYPDIAKEEDTIFFRNYTKKYKAVAWNNPAHYYLRFVHGHNTWDDAHFSLQKRFRNDWNISLEARQYLSHVLLRYQPIIQDTR